MSDLDGLAFYPRTSPAGDVYLVPADVNAEAWARSLPAKKEVILTGRRARSPQFHRLFFAMLRKVIEATGRWETEDELLDALKFAVGHYQTVQTLAGGFERRPKSINFAAMDQTKFKRFVDRCVWAIAEHIGIDAVALLNEVDQEQGGVYAAIKKAKRK